MDCSTVRNLKALAKLDDPPERCVMAEDATTCQTMNVEALVNGTR